MSYNRDIRDGMNELNEQMGTLVSTMGTIAEQLLQQSWIKLFISKLISFVSYVELP